jgi:hypothetical protein
MSTAELPPELSPGLSPVGLLAGRLISLCKEYSAALLLSSGEVEKHCAKIAELRSRRRAGDESAAKEMNGVEVIFGAAHRKISSLQPAIDELARAVSQQLEYAELDFADKLEMKLRLAELEAQMQAAATLASHLPPLMK